MEKEHKKRLYRLNNRTVELLDQIAKHERRGKSQSVEVAIESYASKIGLLEEGGSE